MLKLNFKKSFSKIIFLIFIFSFIQIFIIKNNVSAYNVPTNGCSFSNATYTAYIISTSDLNGTLPLCFRDNDANNALTLKVGTGDSFDDASNKRIKKLSDGTGVEDLADTYTFAGATTHTINYTKNFSGLVTDDITNFFLRDNNTPLAGEATAKYTLTLLPATIGMTVSTSTAGYNYNAAGTAITGSYNDTISPYLGPYQLKYGEQLNFSCDKTTKMAVYSSARNDTSPFYKDLSASNNYSSNQILKNRCLYVFICFY